MAHLALSQDLSRALSLDDGEKGVSIGAIVDSVGDKGFGLLLVVLALPSALPVPAAGYSVPFGIMLFVLGLQMVMGRTKPVIPARLRKVRLNRTMAEKMIGAAMWFFKRIEFLICPRMRWIGSRGGRVFMGVLVLVMAVLMMIPIPTTNTFPAFVIFLIGIGLSEEDGLFAVGACFVGCLAVLLYAALIYFISIYGMEAAGEAKEWVKRQLGGGQ